jgi:hypothetical protein
MEITELEVAIAGAPTDRRSSWRRPTQSRRCCLTCGSDVYADPSRIRWVFSMHVERCSTSTPEERAVFTRTRRWPRKKAPR